MAYSSGRGQCLKANLPLPGHSYHWDEATGVENHNFHSCIYIFCTGESWTCDDFVTADCDEAPWSGVLSAGVNVNNTILILPSSADDYSDYLNGVTTADIVKMARNRLNIEPFDNPYKFVSGDVDYDYDVDEDDEDAVLDLIFGYITEFERTSWEWFRAYFVDNNYSTFSGDPYAYTINEEWPGGIIYPALSYAQYYNYPEQYFDFRTTKIGDVYGCSGTSHNDWICNSCYSLQNPKIKIRSDFEQLDNTRVQKVDLNEGSSFTLLVDIANTQELLGLQLPLLISKESLEIIDIDVSDNLSNLKYSYNKEKGQLVCIWYDKNSQPKTFETNYNLLKIKLVAKSNIDDLSKLLQVDQLRKIEFVDKFGETTSNEFRLQIADVEPNSFDARMVYDTKNTFEIISNLTGECDIKLVNYLGESVYDRKQLIHPGVNSYCIAENILPGVYIIQISFGKYNRSIKFFVH